MSVDITVEGTERMEKILRQAPAELHTALGLIVRDTADDIFGESQRTVPVDKHTLQISGNIRIVSDLAREVGYFAPYAKAVHDGFPEQDVTVKAHSRRIREAFGRRIAPMDVRVRRHRRHIGPREPRPYLDNAVLKTLKKLPEIIANRLRQMTIRLRRG